MTIVTIIRRNLRQRLARNIALVFSVALVAALTTVFVAGRAFFASSDAMNARPMIIVDPIYPYGASLREQDTPKIRTLPHFVDVCRTQTHMASNAEGTYGFAAFGGDESYFTVFNTDDTWFPTTPDIVDRWRKDKTAFVSGTLTAEKMGFEVGKQYTINTNSGPLTGTCVGISRGGANKVNTVWHFDYINEVLGQRSGKITRWIVMVTDNKYMDSTIAAIDDMFRNTSTPTAATPAGDHVQALTSKKRSIVSMLGMVSLLIFFVTMFITFNTVMFLVRERRQVLAAMRAIGYRSRHVFLLVVAEVMALCLLGGVLGVGLMVFYFRGGIPFGDGNLLVTIRPMAIVAGMGVTVLISILASFIPSWLASRVDILSALRST